MSSDVIRALPTLGERQCGPQPKFSGQTPSQKYEADRKADEKGLRTWRAAVQKRDGKVCRCCGRLVANTLSAAPERRECHHITGRADAAVRYDRRNSVQCCLFCHERIERGQIHLVQKPALHFKVAGKPYLNGDKSIRFITKGTP